MNNRFRIPDHLREALDAYAERGRPVGGFLTAVLEDSLSRAISCADEISLAALVDIVKYVYNELPSGCWGSRDKVDAWYKQKDRERAEEQGGPRK